MCMKFKIAEPKDAWLIHELMIQAFSEYKNEVPPSSALDETVDSIIDAMENGEKSLIAFSENIPVAMVRFQLKEDGLYFYRLSVIPEKQGKGIAKKLLQSLEEIAKKEGLTTIYCKVRLNVPRNIYLYQSLGYEITNEEIVHKPNGIDLRVVTMIKSLI